MDARPGLRELKRPFHKPGWVYEEKYDGYRAVAYDSIYEPGVRTKSWIKVKHKVRVGWPEEGVEYTRG